MQKKVLDLIKVYILKRKKLHNEDKRFSIDQLKDMNADYKKYNSMLFVANLYGVGVDGLSARCSDAFLEEAQSTEFKKSRYYSYDEIKIFIKELDSKGYKGYAFMFNRYDIPVPTQKNWRWQLKQHEFLLGHIYPNQLHIVL